MTVSTDKVVREGTILAKGNLTDPGFETFSVREWSDGYREFYNAHFSRWCQMPEKWGRPPYSIQWDGPAKE